MDDWCAEINGDIAPSFPASITRDPTEIVRRCLPYVADDWKKALFKLARWCKDRDDSRDIFRDWYERAGVPVSLHVASEEFSVAMSRAKNAPRIDLADVMQRVLDDPMPPEAIAAFPDSARFQAVMAFCKALQEQVYPADRFYLSCRDLAMLVPGVSHRWANGALRVMVHNGILVVVTPGGAHKGRKATEYRYVLQAPASGDVQW